MARRYRDSQSPAPTSGPVAVTGPGADRVTVTDGEAPAYHAGGAPAYDGSQAPPASAGATSEWPIGHTSGAHPATASPPAGGHDEARDRFGGINWGAGFFGWLVAIGITILLTGIIGAVLAAIGSQTSITQSDAERSAGTIGIAAGVTLLAVLAVAYFTGGYVAGRMSRFDGARQGLAVWVIGLVVTLLVVGIGWLFGSQYNVFDRVSLPRIPLGTDQLSWGGVITAAAVVILTLLAAMLGGKVGHRYHTKVDRAAGFTR